MDRFKVVGASKCKFWIEDKFNSFPPDIILNNYVDAVELNKWLNNNYNNKRFELRAVNGTGLRDCFIVWDNVECKNVKFTPLIQSSDIKSELKEWVDFLNELYECENECE